MDDDRVKKLIRELIIEIGEDPTREGLAKTPERIANTYKEIFGGYDSNSELSVQFSEDSEVVVIRDIQFYSMCEHHMLPFYGKIMLAYSPNGRVFGTTIEDKAKKHSLHDHNEKYQPRLVSIGEGWLVKGFDEALQNTSVGDKKTIEVSAAKGFGERDPGKVRMIPLRKLGEDAEKVSIGDTIEVDNKKGTVRFIGSGRVQMDYNHRFAGKIILYDVNILKELKSDEEKIPGILKRHLPVKDEEISFNKNGKIIDITIPKEIFRAEGLHLNEEDYVHRLNRVRFLVNEPLLYEIAIIPASIISITTALDDSLYETLKRK